MTRATLKDPHPKVLLRRSQIKTQTLVEAPFTSFAGPCESLVIPHSETFMLGYRMEGQPVSRAYIYAFVAVVVGAAPWVQAKATPNCLKDHNPFKLAGDSIEYSMSISPGADCIQGLRWATMQIYSVWILKKPANGELVMVGPGFRYFAKPDFTGTDKFSLVVIGKNLREEGYSTVEITVSRQEPHLAFNALSK
jgi:hypothetical protein